MNQKEVLEVFKETNVLQEGHFKLSSGLHSDRYLQCAQVLQHPVEAQKLAKALADKFEEEIDVVVGPALGGVTLSYAVGLALETRTIFTERKNGEMTLRRGFQLNPGEKVLIVDDVLTTGGSVQEVIDVISEFDIEIAGIATLVDRSGNGVDFPYPIKSLLEVDVKTYQPEEECPLCQKDIGIDKPGSKKETD